VIDLGGVSYIDITSSTAQVGPTGRLIVGQPAPVFTGVNYLGTWKKQEDITASKQVNQIVGGPRFDDPNGNGIITPDEYYVLGSPQADFIYGIQNAMKYKNVEFSFFIQGTKGNEVFNGRTGIGYFTRGEAPKYAEVVNRWTPTNPTSDIPGVGYLGTLPSNSGFVEDGSHMRLKTVRLAYNLPFQDKAIKNLTIYFTGNNLILLSNYRLIDPETNQYNKTSANGNVAQGFSFGEYPTAKSFTFGVNVTF
jgi:TonB-dependent starch-binding outer membrane protein SusC